jgi:selenium donor protein
VLRHVPAPVDPRVLVGAETNDDAAVFRLSSERAIVATLDFFTPIVDDAYTFGAIAAANAFSDVYAMGATPLFALNLVGWPRDAEMLKLLGETLRGGADVAAQAGAFILGGHSIDDAEPKFGMVAIGEVHPERVITNAGAQVGDAVVLTKPLGTGILSTGLKRGVVTEKEMDGAIRSMTTLNRGAAAAMQRLAEAGAVHAATDVTGFGLLGHLRNMLVASQVGARVSASALPVFDRVRELIAEGVIPGGTRRNLESAHRYTRWAGSISEVDQSVATDAQTSGGLLIAVAADAVDDLVAGLKEENTPTAVVIGEVTGPSSGPTIDVS